MFSPQRVSVAQVRRRPGERPEVQAWDSFAKEGSDPDTLKRLRRAKPLRQGRCTTLLRHGQYQMLQVDAPSVPKEEMRNALRWRVKEMVDFPIDQAGVDVLEIPAAQSGPASRAPQVYVVAAGHAVLGPQVRLFQDAKVALEAIDIPELAQRNVAALFEDDNRGLALLAFDDEGGRLTFTYRGELYMSRRIEATREGLAKADASAGGLYERVLLDVQRSLDNFDRNYSAISLTRLLVAPIPEAAGFVDYLKANLYQPVEVLDLGQVLDLGAVPELAEPSRQAEALLAIGAALREEAAVS
ncbi:MAG: agglutinin biogenesis protein MshI [Rhodocyclales bacterium]|nr:agglutinin biogenesis protein MshI [Rhodocyclales bacterium]